MSYYYFSALLERPVPGEPGYFETTVVFSRVESTDIEAAKEQFVTILVNRIHDGWKMDTCIVVTEDQFGAGKSILFAKPHTMNDVLPIARAVPVSRWSTEFLLWCHNTAPAIMLCLLIAVGLNFNAIISHTLEPGIEMYIAVMPVVIAVVSAVVCKLCTGGKEANDNRKD